MSSSLSSLFNRGLLGARCKTCLNLSISRIKLLRNRREVQLAHMRKEIAQFLQTGQEAIARIRVEHVIREHNILAAYEIIELFCEFILARVPILDTQRTCPLELQEAVASIIFAAPRCSDVPELIQIKNLLTTKYGKEFVAAASELRPDSGVNRVIIEKLSIKAPPPDIKLGVMKTIAQEYNVDWDSSITEAEFNKKHEDLLDGLNEVDGNKSTEKSTISNPLAKGNEPVAALNQGQGIQAPAFRPVTISDNTPSSSPVVTNYSTNLLTSSSQQEGSHANDRLVAPQPSSDVLERARAAIASADRACAAARAAANLVNVRMTYQTGSNKQGV